MLGPAVSHSAVIASVTPAADPAPIASLCRAELRYPALLDQAIERVQTSAGKYPPGSELKPFLVLLGQTLALLRPALLRLESETRTQLLNELLAEALDYGPLRDTGRYYLGGLLSNFEGVRILPALQELAERTFLQRLETESLIEIHDLYQLEPLVSPRFLRSHEVSRAVERRVLWQIEHDFYSLDRMMDLPGFEEAREWLSTNPEVRNALRTVVYYHLDQEIEPDPLAILRAVQALDMGDLLEERDCLELVKERLLMALHAGEVDVANHLLSLLPRLPEDLKKFTPQAIAVVRICRNAAYEAAIDLLANVELDQSLVWLVRETVRNFIPPAMRRRELFAATIVEAERELFAKERLSALRLFDLLPEDIRNNLLKTSDIEETAAEALGMERCELNDTIRDLTRQLRCGEELPAPEDIEKLSRRSAACLRVAALYGIDPGLTPLPRQAAAGMESKLDRLFRLPPDQVEWPAPALSVSGVSWARLKVRCQALMADGEQDQAHRLACRLVKAMFRVPGMHEDYRSAGEALHLRAVTAPNLETREALLRETLMFRMRTLGPTAADVAESLTALAATLRRQRRESGVLLATAHIIRSLHGTHDGYQQERYRQAAVTAFQEPDFASQAGISDEWLQAL